MLETTMANGAREARIHAPTGQMTGQRAGRSAVQAMDPDIPEPMEPPPGPDLPPFPDPHPDPDLPEPADPTLPDDPQPNPPPVWS